MRALTSAPALLTLTQAGVAQSERFRCSKQGFGWWYFDVVDAEGNGVVLICSFALPFLPSAPRRPSINLAVYQRGRQVWYGLCEVEAHIDVEGDDEVLHFGSSCIAVRRSQHRVWVEAWLDVQVPGVASAHGLVVIDGVARISKGEPSDSDGVLHAWSPQTGPARGQARLQLDGEEVVVVGRGYHDRNGAEVSLTDLGIERWLWGRVCTPDEERIVYVLWPKDREGAPQVVGLRIDGAGRTSSPEDLRVTLSDDGRAFGMEQNQALCVVDQHGHVFLRARRHQSLEQGPFYMRALWRDEDHDDGFGVYEDVVPGRIDLPGWRPLVAMRVAAGPPRAWSLWLPWFCGGSHNRVRRLLSWWWQRLRWQR